jgi:hypothetical protein
MGSSRPVPSEMQLTSTGTEMTAEEHVVTAETHLRYAEGHLQPSEEHLADAEVHLKLVKANLAILEAVEPAEAGSLETASPPTLEPPAGETSAGCAAPREVLVERAKVAATEGKGSPSGKPKVGLAQRGREPVGGADGAPPPAGGKSGHALSASAGSRQPTPWITARGSRACRLPRGGRCSESGVAASAVSQTARTGKREQDVTGGSGSDGTTC